MASAFWNGQYAIFGDGDTNFPEGERRFGDFARVPTIVWGILTREMIPYIAPLSNRNQSGTLSTSFRDVFAVLVEQWHKHQTVEEADWLMGVGIYATREAISSLKAPGTAYNNLVLGKDPQPSHMDNYVDTPNNNGGVHINSGIPNHAFYLIAKEIGGHAWEEAGQIWYQTLFRLTPTSDFDDFAQKTFGVAGERYGDGSPEQDAVRNGWEAVGISVRQR